MKKLLYCLALLIATSSFAATPVVDEKIAAIFKETFPAAEKVKWYEYEKHVEVFFEHAKIQCRIQYDFDGNIIYQRRDYKEKDLPAVIRAKVKQKHADKKIFGITEVSTPEEGTNYTIILEDETTWYTVQSDDKGRMQVIKKLKKA